ncbi:MAG: cation:proton antiporter [Thermodesulfobacteriota bacterium]
MNLFVVFTILITLTAVFSFVNEAFIKLPTTIGVMLASLASSILIIGFGYLGFGNVDWAVELVQAADFDHLFMNGMLSFLLFAGASSVNIDDLGEYKWTISYLATLGMIIATFLTGAVVWWVLGAIGVDLPLIYALIFGAIISPIDAVIVLKLFRRIQPGKTLESIISGESLFNDAVAVVLFVLFTEIASGETQVSFLHIGEFFMKEALGGLFLGIALGYISQRMIIEIIKRSTDGRIVVALITLSLVAGGYLLAEQFDVSAPLTCVVAGLFLARRRRLMPDSADHVRSYVKSLWEVIDDVMNAILFVLIGLEALVLDLEKPYIICGLISIPLITVARYVSVEVPLVFLKLFRNIPSLSGFIMTWSGIRGGVSIALALSLVDSPQRDLIVIMTYVVVVFSITVQGLTLENALKWNRSRTKSE